MKEEIEKIRHPFRISFICSFGYKIARHIPKKNRNDDVYWLKDENGDMYEVIRKDFFGFVDKRHGGVVMTNRKPRLNPTMSYYMFYNTNFSSKRTCTVQD